MVSDKASSLASHSGSLIPWSIETSSLLSLTLTFLRCLAFFTRMSLAIMSCDLHHLLYTDCTIRSIHLMPLQSSKSLPFKRVRFICVAMFTKVIFAIHARRSVSKTFPSSISYPVFSSKRRYEGHKLYDGAHPYSLGPGTPPSAAIFDGRNPYKDDSPPGALRSGTVASRRPSKWRPAITWSDSWECDRYTRDFILATNHFT